MLKEVLSYSGLDTQIRYVHERPELLLIMLQLVNMDLNSSLRKNLSVHVAHTWLNHEDIFFIIAEDSTVIGIQEEILLAILLGFWKLILMLSLS